MEHSDIISSNTLSASLCFFFSANKMRWMLWYQRSKYLFNVFSDYLISIFQIRCILYIFPLGHWFLSSVLLNPPASVLKIIIIITIFQFYIFHLVIFLCLFLCWDFPVFLCFKIICNWLLKHFLNAALQSLSDNSSIGFISVLASVNVHSNSSCDFLGC